MFENDDKTSPVEEQRVWGFYIAERSAEEWGWLGSRLSEDEVTEALMAGQPPRIVRDWYSKCFSVWLDIDERGYRLGYEPVLTRPHDMSEEATLLGWAVLMPIGEKLPVSEQLTTLEQLLGLVAERADAVSRFVG